MSSQFRVLDVPLADTISGRPTSAPGNLAAQASPTPQNQEASVSPSALDCEPSRSSLYCIYEVQEGDSLSAIAANAGLEGTEGVSAWQLLVESNRPELVSEDDVLQVGAKLRIPTGNGLIHTVHSEETLSDLASQFDVSVADIIASNAISDADVLQIGQDLLIPSPNRLAPPSAPEPEQSDPGSMEEPASSPGAGFVWPAYGPLTNYYGPSHPLGIDIDVDDSSGAANVAAAAGTVTFAGGDPCCSYGYYVIVDHGNGIQTLYAHFASIWVNVGDQVAQGQPLGAAGSTGYSTGTHLHFEVLNSGIPVDPTVYLP